MKPALILLFLSFSLLAPSRFQPACEGSVALKTEKFRDLPYKKVIATKNITASLSNFVNLMYDEGAYSNWLYSCRQATIIERTSERDGYYFFLYRSGAFMSDRYLLAYAVISQDVVTKTVTFTVRQVQEWEANFSPEISRHPKAVEARYFEGQWIFRPDGAGCIEVTYELYIDPGVSALASPFITGNLKTIAQKTLENLSAIVKKEKYKHKNPLIIDPDDH